VDGEAAHFLNTVYERFFQGFSVKRVTLHGIDLHAAGDCRFHVLLASM
jgi:hypothetical protein